MLCPEVWDFPPPKIISTCKQYENLDSVVKSVKMNNFYKSIIITCPDELQTPNFIEEVLTEDSEYYKISDCLLTEFIEPNFIENFVKSGNIYCLSADRNCIVQNCASITPDGMLTLNVLGYIFQTTGLEGTKRPHNYYEIKIDLKNLKHLEKLRKSLQMLETFDFYIYWEPNSEDICPSSLAKYFYDREINVAVQSLQITRLTPTVEEIPVLKDVEIDEMVEWIGMLAHEGDLHPKEMYVSTYGQPDSESALKSTRISLVTAKGFITPTIVGNLCKHLSNYVLSRELDNYWTCLSIQSNENSLWQWSPSCPRMFQAQDASCNIFFTNTGHTMYSIGQLKYS